MKILELFHEVLNEAVSRGVLYHFTNKTGFSINVKNQGFKFHDMEYVYDKDPMIGKFSSALSTTRLYNLKWGSIRFNLNGDYISSKYSIKPVHYYNISQDSEKRSEKGMSSDGVPINQYEETILSKQPKHIMPLNNNTVFSVDILISDDDMDMFITKYSNELKELSSLGIPYNFVSSFKPFKSVDKINVSSIKQDVIELLRLRDEDDIIKFLEGRDNIKEILSDVRIIMMVSSRAYLRLLRLMVKLGIDLGINDYDDMESKNIWTGMVRKSQVKLDDYLAIKAAGSNKDVLSILMTSDSIPIDIKYEIAIKYKLEQFYDMLYKSDLSVENKIRLSLDSNNYSVFDMYFDDSKNKQFMCVFVSVKKLDKRFAEKCLSSDIGNGLKHKISVNYNIGDSGKYYEEPKLPNDDDDLPF
jgi:hypothetical protein